VLSDLPTSLQYLDLRSNLFCNSAQVNIPCAYVHVDGTCRSGSVTFKRTCSVL